jgi:curved DNA-binding protein CbpA
MAKSYFAILGVPVSASPEEVRAAYRRLAKVYHPDYFPGGSDQFREIQEAYAVLNDQRKRAAYEHTLEEDAPDTFKPRSGWPGPPRAPYPQGAPEPIVPLQAAGPVGMGSTPHGRPSRGPDPSVGDLIDWLLGLPFRPGKY